MRKPNPVEDEIDAIRLALCEEIKDMGSSPVSRSSCIVMGPVYRLFFVLTIK